MQRNVMRSQRLVFLFMVGYLLLNYPLLFLFDVPQAIWGIPLLYGYIFLVWAMLIALAGVITGTRESGLPPRNTESK
ncbi:MAG: hypothetical protein HKP58_00320 [Desulfatitalea sp.]|nr:hypothetical protein [Desulfatitalea sp.]NNJ98834.1 hypothetical protein [Desulfatitalea sp.]